MKFLVLRSELSSQQFECFTTRQFQLSVPYRCGCNDLPEELRKRYEPSRNQLFGSWKKDDDWTAHRQEVAENLYRLCQQFAQDQAVAGLAVYQSMNEIFRQQCQVIEADESQTPKVQVRKAPGGNIIVNPSDPDATLDGHKGSGYQIQLSETCSGENEVQLIVSAIAQPAHESDAAALPICRSMKDYQKLSWPTPLMAATTTSAPVRAMESN